MFPTFFIYTLNSLEQIHFRSKSKKKSMKNKRAKAPLALLQNITLLSYKLPLFYYIY